jgi:hypothetical protein
MRIEGHLWRLCTRLTVTRPAAGIWPGHLLPTAEVVLKPTLPPLLIDAIHFGGSDVESLLSSLSGIVVGAAGGNGDGADGI